MVNKAQEMSDFNSQFAEPKPSITHDLDEYQDDSEDEAGNL
jgi:hypothetical protein